MFCTFSLLLQTGCSTAYKKSLGQDTENLYTKIYLSTFDTVWQATLDSLKSHRLDVSNRESGYIQTRWQENTSEKNFVDSFGGAGAYLKAQFRFRISVSQGFFNGVEAVRVTVQKEQLIQRDVLEGWKPVETDSIEEATLLYRIGRLTWIRIRLAQIEEDKTRREMEEQNIDSGPSAPEFESNEEMPPPPEGET